MSSTATRRRALPAASGDRTWWCSCATIGVWSSPSARRRRPGPATPGAAGRQRPVASRPSGSRQAPSSARCWRRSCGPARWRTAAAVPTVSAARPPPARRPRAVAWRCAADPAAPLDRPDALRPDSEDPEGPGRVSSRRCWSLAGASRWRCTRSPCRPTSRASAPAASMTWSSRWAAPGSAQAR